MADKRAEHGYTMLELAVVLTVMGVLLVIAMYFRNSNQGRSTENAADFQEQIIASIYSFAERNYRLPCADTTGDGYEGGGSPRSCSTTDTSYVVGAVPFKTLGLSTPTAIGNGFDKRFIYGVYRKTAINADLARLIERTGDAPGDSGYLQLNDFKMALRNANAALNSTTDTTRIYVTGNGGSTGASNCASNQIVNVAFFVVDSGANGTFDGANSPLIWPAGGSTCVSGPNTPASSQYDDTVRAIGFSELLGYISH